MKTNLVKRGKQALSILLSFALAVTLVPVTSVEAFADELDGAVAAVSTIAESGDATLEASNDTLQTAATSNSKRSDSSTMTTSYTVLRNLNTSSYDAESNVAVTSNLRATVTHADGSTARKTIKSSGKLSLPIQSESDYITISSYASGYTKYSPRTIKASNLSNTKTIRLQQVDDNHPVLNAVWLTGYDMLMSDVVLTDSQIESTMTMEFEIDWGSAGSGTVQLIQGNETYDLDLSLDETGVNYTAQVNMKELNWSADAHVIKIKATDANGNITTKTLNLVAESASALTGFMYKKADGSWGLQMVEGMYYTLNSDVPFVGGTVISVPNFSSMLGVNVDIGDGEWALSIGGNVLGFSDELKDDGSREKEVKTFRSAWKESGLGSLVGTSEIKKSAQKFMKLASALWSGNAIDYIKKNMTTYCFTANLYVFGYLQGEYGGENGTRVNAGGLIINPQIFVNSTVPLAGIVSVEFRLSGEANAKVALGIRDSEKATVPRGSLSLSVTSSVGLLLGLPKILAVGGGVEGSFEIATSYYSRNEYPFTLQLDGSIGVYGEVNVLFFEARKTWNFASGTIYQYPSSDINPQSLSLASSDEETVVSSSESVEAYGGNGDNSAEDLNDISTYTIDDVSYLASGSSTTESEITTLASDGVTGNEVGVEGDTVDSNIYRSSEVRYVNLGSTTNSEGNEVKRRLMLWNDAATTDKNSSVTNDKITLMYRYGYSTDDGESWTWSEPAKVNEESNTYEGLFDVTSDENGNAYVSWQSVTKKTSDLSAQATSEGTSLGAEAAEASDICVTKLSASADGTSASASNTLSLGTEYLDMSACITTNSDAGKTYVAWLSNDANDLYGITGQNTINYAEITSSETDGEVKLTAGDTQAVDLSVSGGSSVTVSDLALDLTDEGALQLAYITDSDNNLSTLGATSQLWYTKNVLTTEATLWAQGDDAVSTAEGSSGTIGTDESTPTSSSATSVALPKFFDHYLFYTNGGVVQIDAAMDVLGQDRLTISSSENSTEVSSDYHITTVGGNDDPKLVLITLANDGLNTTLKAAYLTVEETTDDDGNDASQIVWSSGIDLYTNGNTSSDESTESTSSSDYGYAIRSFDILDDYDSATDCMTYDLLVNNSTLTSNMEELMADINAASTEEEKDNIVNSYNPYGTSQLQTLSIIPYVKPEIETTEVYYDMDDFVEGNTLAVEIPVTNSGALTAQGVTDWTDAESLSNLKNTIVAWVQVLDENGDVLTENGVPVVGGQVISSDLAPGASTTVAVSLEDLTENVINNGKKLRVMVSSITFDHVVSSGSSDSGESSVATMSSLFSSNESSSTDTNDEASSSTTVTTDGAIVSTTEYTVDLGYEDIEVGNMDAVRDENNNVIFSADVNNYGYTDVTNIKAELRRVVDDDETGESIPILEYDSVKVAETSVASEGESDDETIAEGTVEALGQGVATFTVPADQVEEGDLYYIYLSSYDGMTELTTVASESTSTTEDGSTTTSYDEANSIGLANTRYNDYDYTSVPASITTSDDGSDDDGSGGDGTNNGSGDATNDGSGSGSGDGSGNGDGSGSYDTAALAKTADDVPMATLIVCVFLALVAAGSAAAARRRNVTVSAIHRRTKR